MFGGSACPEGAEQPRTKMAAPRIDDRRATGILLDDRSIAGVTGLFWFGLLLLACYWPVLVNMADQWQTDDNAAHGFFAPFVAGYMVWEKRAELARFRSGAPVAGFFICCLGMVQAFLGTLGAELFIARSAFLVSLAGVIIYFLGFQAIRALSVPLLVSAFMVPIPGIASEQITFPLQMLASRISEHFLEFLGFSVFRDGNILEMAGHRLAIVEACSGIRSLFSLLFLSLTYTYFLETSTRVRILLFLSTIPIAILTNAGRIVVLGIMTNYDPALADSIFHALSGWVLSLIGFALIVALHYIGSFLSRIIHGRHS